MKWKSGMLVALMVLSVLLGGCGGKKPSAQNTQGTPQGQTYIEQAFDGNATPGLIGTAVNAQGELVAASQPSGKPLNVTTYDQQGRKKNSVDTDITDAVSAMALGADGSVYALANPKDGVMTVHVLDASGKTTGTIALSDLPSNPMVGEPAGDGKGAALAVGDDGPSVSGGGDTMTQGGGPAVSGDGAQAGGDGPDSGPAVRGGGPMVNGQMLSIVTDMETTPDGGVVLSVMGKGIVQYGKDGNPVRTLGNAMLGLLAADGKGTLWVFEQGRDGATLKNYDLSNGTEVSSTQPQGSIPSALFYDRQGQRLLAMTDRDIHPLGADGKAGAALSNFGDTTLGDGSRTLLGFAIDGGGSLYVSAATGEGKSGISVGGPAGAISLSPNSTGDQMVRLALGDASSVKAKTVITMAALVETQALKTLIAAFQQAYPDYRIDLKTYSSQVSGMKRTASDIDYSDAIQQFNTDLMSGKGADILVLDNLAYQKYLDKGLLADLTPLMQQAQLDMSLYYTNILDACRVNGKLYALPGSFTFSLLAGRAADMPAGDPPSMADFLTKAGSLSDGRAAFPARDPVELLVGYARHNYDDLVDAAAHKANFDSPAFVQMLDQFKALTDANPAPQNGEDAAPAFADLMNGKGSYAVVDLRSPMELGLARTVLGDDLALSSLPTLQGGDAHDFEPGMLLGINNAAKDQKMAFEVLKTMLSDTVQSGIQMEGLPVLKSASDKTFAQMGGDSGNVKMRAVLKMGDKEIEVKPLTAEDIALATAKIGGLNRALVVDSAVTAVLKEELPAFFSGQKTAQEVASLIQNRVTTMLNE